MKATPVTALYVEMGEMLLNLWRWQMELTYWANLKGHNENDLQPCQEKQKKQQFLLENSEKVKWKE